MHSPTHPLFPLSWPSQRCWRGLACVALCVLLAACGFRIKGVSPLPFTTVYTNITENSAFGASMRRAVVASSPHTRFVDEPADAQVKLLQLSNNQSLHELSINAQGQVEEYELNLEFVFQLTDAQNHLLLPPTTIRSTREVPYDPNIVQAKQGEIATVFMEMQQSLVDRIVRLLTSPDVTEAFANAKSMPVDESAASTAPVPSTQPDPSVTPWGSPRIESGAGMR